MALYSGAWNWVKNDLGKSYSVKVGNWAKGSPFRITSLILAGALTAGVLSYYSCRNPVEQQKLAAPQPNAEKVYVDKRVKIEKGRKFWAWNIVKREYGVENLKKEYAAQIEALKKKYGKINEDNAAIALKVNEVADFNVKEQSKHPHFGYDTKAVIDGYTIDSKDGIRCDELFYSTHKNSKDGDEVILPGLKVEVPLPASTSVPANTSAPPSATSAAKSNANVAKYDLQKPAETISASTEVERGALNDQPIDSWYKNYDSAAVVAKYNELAQNSNNKGNVENLYKQAIHELYGTRV